MDFAYIAAPVITTLVFAAFAIATDERKHSITRLLFFFGTIASLLVTGVISLDVMTWGEQLPANATSIYEYNGTGYLMNITTSYNYTGHTPVLTTGIIPAFYQVLLAVIVLIFGIWLLNIFSFAWNWIAKTFGWKHDENE